MSGGFFGCHSFKIYGGHEMLSCAKCRKRLGVYLDGELTQRERKSIERHLAKCESCNAALKELRSLEALMHTLDVPPAPAALTSRILAEVYKKRGRLRKYPVRWWYALAPRLRVLKSATAATLILGLTVGAYMGWSTFQGDKGARFQRSEVLRDSAGELSYALRTLSASSPSSIEAATLALLESGGQ